MLYFIQTKSQVIVCTYFCNTSMIINCIISFQKISYQRLNERGVVAHSFHTETAEIIDTF